MSPFSTCSAVHGHHSSSSLSATCSRSVPIDDQYLHMAIGNTLPNTKTMKFFYKLFTSKFPFTPLFKEIPPATCSHAENIHKVKLSAIFASRPCPRIIFPIVHEHKWYFNWFIATNIFQGKYSTLCTLGK